MSGAPTESRIYDRSGQFSHTDVPHSRRAWRLAVTIAALASLLLPGCRTKAEIAAEEQAAIQSLVGGTMADFTRRTGWTPTDMYPTGSGRTFVVDLQPRTIIVPGSYGVPTVVAHRQCRMLVETEGVDGLGTADSWRIARITRAGAC